MAHVTFIHGISNMPPKDVLLENWLAGLAAGGFDLDTAHVTSSMVYWADVVYAEPHSAGADFESVDAALGTTEADDTLAWLDSLPPEERRFNEALIARLGIDEPPPDGNPETQPHVSPAEDAPYDFEAIPVPWFIKARVMKRFLKDVHHYLFNAEFSPRPGENFEVRTHIRKLFVEQLLQDQKDHEGPHVVVSHSMGTVISYDCLKNVEGCPAIDGYLTCGSPLGISEIHDKFDPRYDKTDAFPSATLKGDWINVYDRLDPVAFDARIANDYQQAGRNVISDERVRNSGRWRHSSHKYYGQTVLRDHLRRMLQLD